MTTAIATTQDFQQRMFEKIRDQMGDFLTDDDLKKIIEAAVLKGFFEERRVERQYGGYDREEAVFVKLVREEVRAQAEKCIAAWLKENEAKVAAAIQDAIAGGMTRLLLNFFDSRTSFALHQFAENLKSQGLR